jgi:cation transport protein ChaC
MTDEDFRALALRLSLAVEEAPLQVFAYGSLIWKPEFESVEQQLATAYGWHRSFCLDMIRWRGSAEQPGLMMALERGGRCDGVVYRLPDGDKPAQIERLLRREISDHESVGSVRWLPVHTPQGLSRALGFWVGVKGRGTSLNQPLERVAQVLARACGHIGSGAEYLYNTVSHLEAFGIRDRNLWRLQELVADEIRTMHGAANIGPAHMDNAMAQT